MSDVNKLANPYHLPATMGSEEKRRYKCPVCQGVNWRDYEVYEVVICRFCNTNFKKEGNDMDINAINAHQNSMESTGDTSMLFRDRMDRFCDRWTPKNCWIYTVFAVFEFANMTDAYAMSDTLRRMPAIVRRFEIDQNIEFVVLIDREGILTDNEGGSDD